MAMLLRLRVSLPDRPGSLGQVARALGTLGADILQVTVLEREAGRAVDDFVVSWAAAPEPGGIGERLSAVPGVRVEGVWPTRDVPGSAPDHDLLRHVAADPGRAVPTLVDAAPDLVGADWAVAVWAETGLVAQHSWRAPDPVELPELVPLRPAALTVGETRLLSLPLAAPGLHLIVARTGGPPFHRAELDKIVRVADIVSVLARAVAGKPAEPANH
jgi:hypothetical protein